MWWPISISNTFVSVFGYPLSYIELAGTLTGLISVWLAAKAKIWTWPTGLINVSCFFLIFFEIHLYADMFLQVYFFITSVYGWIIWKSRRNHRTIEALSTTKRTWLIIVIITSTVVFGLLVKNIHLLLPIIFNKPASYPFPDTFVAVISIIATILLAQKKLENWILWITADIISIVMYAKKGVLFISIEYAVFLCLATWGLLTWRKLFLDENRAGIG